MRSSAKIVRRVVDESLLGVLVADAEARRLFPMFDQAAAALAAGRTCCRHRHSHHTADLRALKQRVQNMDTAATQRLKDYLKVDKLLFYAAGPAGLVTIEK